MEKQDLLSKLFEQKVISVIRSKQSIDVDGLAETLISGGLTSVEITLNTLNALELVERLSSKYGAMIQVGVGTVLNIRDAQEAMNAGAQFIVTPMADLDIISFAVKNRTPVFPGGLTPTEIFKCYEAGADVVKVFPASALGMSYLKALKGPFPNIPLMPTGGVDVENAAIWLENGASLVGLGTSFIDDKLLRSNNWNLLTERIRKLNKSFDAISSTNVESE